MGEGRNSIWARVFMEELARAGVREVCVCPGSRSTPLVLAAASESRFQIVPLVDERSAGFFALGVGKGTGRPAAVITTSGTAAANLYPAVIEASQGEVPLLVLTADRPHRLRDTDGNQAMDQLRLFGVFPRGFFEVAPPAVEDESLRHLRVLAARSMALATGVPPGPVHLNFPFEKPLEPVRDTEDVSTVFAQDHSLALRGRPEGGPFTEVSRRRFEVAPEEVRELVRTVAASSRGLIVAGPSPRPEDDGPAVRALGAATGFPVLADPLSGARFGGSETAQMVDGYDLFLRSPDAVQALGPDLVVRCGASPTSAALQSYLSEHQHQRCPHVVVDGGHRWKDHLASARQYFQVSPAPFLSAVVEGLEGGADMGPSLDPDWGPLWAEAEDRARAVLRDLPGEGLLEGEILACVARTIPEGSNLMVSNSMPIRDLDAFGSPGEKTIRVFGNRGVSGIDGIVSTTLGLQWGRGGVTVGVLGDLAFYHDMNGLLPIRTQGIPVVFVVLNNNGGGIFHTLPVRDFEPAFTRFFATPHGLDFQRTAELYGLAFHRAYDLDGFREAFESSLSGGEPAMVEVMTDRAGTHRRRREVQAAVERVMEDLGV